MRDDVLKAEQKIKEQLESILNVSDVPKETPEDTPKNVEVFRRDSRIRDLSLISSCPIQIPSPQRVVKQRPTISISDIYSPPSSSKDFIHPRPQTPYRPRNPRRSFSTSEISSPPSTSPFGSPPLLTLHPATPQISPDLKPVMAKTGQTSDVEVLRSALKIIQSQLTLLDNGIKANIASQLAQFPSPTTDPLVVIDQDSLPNFSVPGDEIDSGVSRALLKTVKVCCIVERGLEAVIGVLEYEDKNDKVGTEAKKGVKGWEEQVREWGTGVGKRKEEGDLMGACLERGKVVRREMRGALRGIEGVVGFGGK